MPTPTDTPCDWELTAIVVHEWTGDAPLERSIAEGIADLSPPETPRPTADDADRVAAVDRLFSEAHLVDGELELRYAGYDVTVKPSGVVRVEGPAGE
jgi:hypothetical protein